MKVETDRLKTIKNYANEMTVTTSYIYKMIRENTMHFVMIDGVKFIDVVKFPKLPTR